MPLSCLRHSRFRQLSWIMVTHVRAPSEAPISSIPLLFRQPWPRLFLWVLFSSGIASYTPQKSVIATTASLSLPARVSQEVSSDPSRLYFKVLPRWVIFLFFSIYAKRGAGGGIWKPVPLRFNLMHLGHKFLFHEAGCISPVSKPQFLHP